MRNAVSWTWFEGLFSHWCPVHLRCVRVIVSAVLVPMCGALVSVDAAAATIEGKVIKVTDGDTITIVVKHQKHQIRLQGIDAPEREQPFSRASWRALSALLAGKQVRVEYDKRDSYGRVIGVVWVRPPIAPCDSEPCPKTLDAGLNQLTVGMAWWYRYYASEQTREERVRYEFAEAEAKSKKAGLWADSDPTPPWYWRRKRRSK